MCEDVGLRNAQIAKESDRIYGTTPRYLTAIDLTRFLAGDGLTKVRKLAILVDVLGLSHGEIARLLRQALPPRVSQPIHRVEGFKDPAG